MGSQIVNLSIPLESLLESISALSPREKLQIMQALHEQLEHAEEEYYESDPQIQAEIREARLAYQAKDYTTIDEYIARKQK